MLWLLFLLLFLFYYDRCLLFFFDRGLLFFLDDGRFCRCRCFALFVESEVDRVATSHGYFDADLIVVCLFKTIEIDMKCCGCR